jgi:hypothetical protein
MLRGQRARITRHSPDGSYRKLSLLQFGFPGKAEPSRLRPWPSRSAKMLRGTPEDADLVVIKTHLS